VPSRSIGDGGHAVLECGRPAVARDICALIRQMRSANPLWAPRIHGELRKLGARLFGRCEHTTGIEPFDRLVALILRTVGRKSTADQSSHGSPCSSLSRTKHEFESHWGRHISVQRGFRLQAVACAPTNRKAR